jgi:hypothetical protein
MGDIAQPLHTEEFGLGANNISVTFNSYSTNMVRSISLLAFYNTHAKPAS